MVAASFLGVFLGVFFWAFFLSRSLDVVGPFWASGSSTNTGHFPYRRRIQVLLTITEALGVISGFEASLQGSIKVDGTFV
jgi:hypothetical protein